MYTHSCLAFSHGDGGSWGLNFICMQTDIKDQEIEETNEMAEREDECYEWI